MNLSILYNTSQRAGGRVPYHPCVRPATGSTQTTRCEATGRVYPARGTSVYWLARQIEDCRSLQAANISSFAKTDWLNQKSQLGPSTIATNTALARGRRAKQPEVGTDLPWRLAAHCWLHCTAIVNTFKSSYLHSILCIAIIETLECQHCIVWQWAAFWARGNGKFPTTKQRKFDLNLSGR